MVTGPELMGGLSALKTAFDLTKGLKEIGDAASLNSAVIELQEKILTAQQAQATLLSRVGELEEEVANFKTWETDKQRYVLKQVGYNGTLVYEQKEGVEGGEAPHSICPDCYQNARRSILQKVHRSPGRSEVLVCQQCSWEAYTEGDWRPEHGGAKTASRRSR